MKAVAFDVEHRGAGHLAALQPPAGYPRIYINPVVAEVRVSQ